MEVLERFDGNAAMTACNSAADYRSVCAGHTGGDPSLRSTWKLPHHDRPGAPFDPQGVAAARARFDQTQGLTNREEARRHLFETHKLPSDTRDMMDPDSFPAPGDAAGLKAHLQELDHALKGTGTDGLSFIELQQMHWQLHEKETPDHIHPEMDLDNPNGVHGELMASALPRDDLYRAVYPGVSVRDVSDGQPVLAGHFARFGEWTEIDSVFEGRFMERIAPGAFAESFRTLTPKVLFQHGRDPEIGDKVLGSPVTVREDDMGAAYEVPLFPSVPPLIVDGLRAGAYGASFRFHVDSEEVQRKAPKSSHNPEGLPERTIVAARVSEFGPVTFPAYAGATAGIRSLTDEFHQHTFNDQLAAMVRQHPKDLAAVIQDVLRDTKAEGKPPEDKPQPQPQPRFRTREEYLAWLSKS